MEYNKTETKHIVAEAKVIMTHNFTESSNVLYYGSLSLETILWLTFDGNHIFFKKMVSQSKNGKLYIFNFMAK